MICNKVINPLTCVHRNQLHDTLNTQPRFMQSLYCKGGKLGGAWERECVEDILRPGKLVLHLLDLHAGRRAVIFIIQILFTLGKSMMLRPLKVGVALLGSQ